MFSLLNSPAVFALARLQRALCLVLLILAGMAIQAAIPDRVVTGSVASSGAPQPLGAPLSLTSTQPRSATATVTGIRSATATATLPRSATTAPRSVTTAPKSASATNSRIGRSYSFTVGAY